MSRMASANGTRTACAQYRTATTSTPPANVTQGFTDFKVSSRVLLRSSAELQSAAYFSNTFLTCPIFFCTLPASTSA